MVELLQRKDDATVASVGKRIKELALAHPIPESF
jgi:hypothetical protein